MEPNIQNTNNNHNKGPNDNNIECGAQNANDDQSQQGGNERSFCDHLQLNRRTQPSCIIFALNIGHFQIKLEVVQLLLKFNGMDKESPCLHFRGFEEAYATINLQNISVEQLS